MTSSTCGTFNPRTRGELEHRVPPRPAPELGEFPRALLCGRRPFRDPAVTCSRSEPSGLGVAARRVNPRGHGAVHDRRDHVRLHQLTALLSLERLGLSWYLCTVMMID